MTQKTLLTVNVVTYNHKKWISKCLDSILEQKTNFKFIIRIFDDCSTDGTIDICKYYTKKYPEIINFYPSSKNLGITNNVLRSYRGITTPYYLYIEGDDWRDNINGFQEQIDCLEKFTNVIACMSHVKYYENGTYTKSTLPLHEGIYTLKYVIEHPEHILYSNLLTRIVRTEAININKTYPQAYIYDVTQIYELLQQGHLYFIKKEYGVYNKTHTGITTSLKLFERINFTYQRIYKYNKFTNNKFQLNLIYFLHYTILWTLNTERKYNTYLQTLHNTIYLLVPPLIYRLLLKVYIILKTKFFI